MILSVSFWHFNTFPPFLDVCRVCVCACVYSQKIISLCVTFTSFICKETAQVAPSLNNFFSSASVSTPLVGILIISVSSLPPKKKFIWMSTPQHGRWFIQILFHLGRKPLKYFHFFFRRRKNSFAPPPKNLKQKCPPMSRVCSFISQKQ